MFKILSCFLCFPHYSSIPRNELSLKPHNFNCCGCLLVTVCLDRFCQLSSMLDHLTPPMGQVDKIATFWKTYFKGFCENLMLLILPRICSQKIKDSESKLINSSIFIVSPPRSQEKRCLTLPHFTLHTVANYKSIHQEQKLRMPLSPRLQS